MTETTGSGSGGTRVGAVLGVLGLVAGLSVAAIALGSGTPAAAEGLERFADCAELEAWSGDVLAPDVAVEDLDTRAGSGPPSTVADLAAEAGRASAAGSAPVAQDGEAAAALPATGGDDTGGTNTVVEGVDEVDVIDRVGEDRLLVSRSGVLALVDLDGRAVVAERRGVPYDARISVAGDLVWIAGTAVDGTGTVVQRVRIDGDTLVDDGAWRTPGYLQDARRTGDTLHVVAVDHPAVGAAPFAGGPVPCDEVWRPAAPSAEPAATLVASLPAEGPLEPAAAAQVTGSAGNLLVTDAAVYIATQVWSGDGTVPTTGIHRFELAGLNLTGSGSVPGIVAGPFAMNEHDGHLRVATNAGFGFLRGMPIEGDVIVDTAEAPALDPAVSGPVAPGGGAGALAEVLVLDLEGDLDVVGRTGRFGHDGETIHGVRFVGDVAYVVTFLQTDPFWVIDLADPAAPAVVGELQIPGFSGYLHPVAEDLVVGFGPDGEGRTSARLFDVADPEAPAVVDELVLGDDSPAAYDHHAFVGLGDRRFAVPFTDYPRYVEVAECEAPVPPPVPIDPIPVDPDPGGTVTSVPPDAAVDPVGSDTPTTGTTVPPEVAVDGDAGEPGPSTTLPGAAADPGRVTEPYPYCPAEPVGGQVGAVELAVEGRALVEVTRSGVERPEAVAERVVLAPDGTWLVLGWDRLIATDGGADVVLPTA